MEVYPTWADEDDDDVCETCRTSLFLCDVDGDAKEDSDPFCLCTAKRRAPSIRKELITFFEMEQAVNRVKADPGMVWWHEHLAGIETVPVAGRILQELERRDSAFAQRVQDRLEAALDPEPEPELPLDFVELEKGATVSSRSLGAHFGKLAPEILRLFARHLESHPSLVVLPEEQGRALMDKPAYADGLAHVGFWRLPSDADRARFRRILLARVKRDRSKRNR
jgi:hypothetical protein